LAKCSGLRSKANGPTSNLEFGIQGTAAFAWKVELANGERWYIVRHTVSRAHWFGEPVA
jgi:hypothetical protein